MKKMITGILVLLGFNLMAQRPAVVSGTENGWYRIGRITADFDKERESIIVMGRDEFNSIKLRVNDAAVRIDRMQIHFEGGKTQDIDVRQRLQPGDETRTFDLNAQNKEIDKVVFTYHTLSDGRYDKAEVELYGFKGADTREQRERSEQTGYRERDDEFGNHRSRESSGSPRDVRERAREASEDFEEAAEEAGEEINEASDEFDYDENDLNEAADETRSEWDAQEGDGSYRTRDEWRDEVARERHDDERDYRDDAQEHRYEEGIENRERRRDDREKRKYRTEDEREPGADNFGDEVREHTNKLESEISDRELEDKAGPDGQEVYIDDNNNFYYIDEFGNRMYVTPEELTPRTRD